MKKSIFCILFLIMAALLWCTPVSAAETGSAAPDMLIRINRLEYALDLIETITSGSPGGKLGSPAAFIRAMLQGTEWIDPNRSIVIGFWFDGTNPGQPPEMAAVVPFATPNTSFQAMHQATAGDDYYLVPLPPGSHAVVTGNRILELAGASRKKTQGLVSIDIAVSRMLNGAEQEIQKKMEKFSQKIASPAENAPEDASAILESLIKTGRQIDIMTMGIDVDNDNLIVMSDFRAVEKSALFSLLSRDEQRKTTLLAGYVPQHDITFRSASYDISGMMNWLDSLFGTVYRKLGIDLADMQQMAANFTGEMVGGMSFTGDGLDLSFIMTMHQTDETKTNFMEDVYIPWAITYFRDMAGIMEQINPKTTPVILIEQTPPTMVAGQKVYGIRGELPIPGADKEMAKDVEFEVRLAVVNPFLLVASDDANMLSLIEAAAKAEEKSYSGPMMNVEVKLDQYLESMKTWLTEFDIPAGGRLPELGTLNYTVDVAGGTLNVRYTMRMKDIRSLSNFANRRSDAAPADTGPGVPSHTVELPNRLMPAEESAKEAEVSPEETARYWIDKGALYATYGNNSSAINFYQKALQIEPDNSEALFNAGISYGDSRQYDQAVDSISRAIRLAPENGNYYYGRGWVYQLSGDMDKAMTDIRTAADLGSTDALNFIKKQREKKAALRLNEDRP